MERLEEEDCLLADGFEMALIGITCGIEPVAVYDINKMTKILVSRDEMTEEDAIEYLQFNVIGAFVGEKTPIYIDLDFMRACAIVI
jgi:hypothetical protein